MCRVWDLRPDPTTTASPLKGPFRFTPLALSLRSLFSNENNSYTADFTQESSKTPKMGRLTCPATFAPEGDAREQDKYSDRLKPVAPWATKSGRVLVRFENHTLK